MHLTIFLIPIAVVIFVMRLPNVASRAMILRIIAIGLERKVSLPPLIKAFANESGWWERRRLHQLANRLGAGFTVSEALDSLGGFVPAEISAAAFTAEQCGNLPQTLKRLSSDWERTALERGQQLPITLLYFAILCSLVMAIVGFLSIWILPKFKAIFRDFNLDMPNHVVGVPLSFDELHLVMAWTDVMVLFILAAFVFTGRLYFSRFFGGEWLGSVYEAWFFKFKPDRQTPLILKSLQVPLENGKPLAVAVETLTVHHPYPFMRSKMISVLDDLTNGLSCWESLQNLKLLNPLQRSLLETAERNEHLEWTLGELAGNFERRTNRRLQVLGMILQPCALLMLGLFIGWIVLTFFYPLIFIMDHLQFI